MVRSGQELSGVVRSMYDSGPRPDKVLLDSSDNVFYLFLYKVGLCVLVL